MLRTSSRWLAAASSLSVLVSCGGKVGDVVRPTDYDAAGALGGKRVTCAGPPKLVTPIVVDLEPEARMALELSLKKHNVAVVAYDCSQLRVLPNCHGPEGAYEYAGTSKNEKVIQLKGEDQLKVNLPLSAGKLGGEVQSGRSIDIGLVYAGQSTTGVGAVKRAELTGTCEGATHYVQIASLGAFAMSTGSGGKVAAAAELFSIGAAGSSEASRKAKSSNGSLEACRSANPDDTKPPGECRAPLTVELTPLTGTAVVAVQDEPKPGKPAADAAESTVKPIENPCPEGYVLSQGVCSKPAADVAFLCDPKKPDECNAQCEKGSVESCYNYGVYAKNHEDAGDEAAPYFEKACAGGSAAGCAYQGFMLAKDKDPNDNSAILALYQKACDQGFGRGCFFLSARLKKSDAVGKFKTLERGCKLGHATSCSFTAMSYFSGTGVAKDPKKGLEVYGRACQSGDAGLCSELAETLRSGKDVPKDLPRALAVSRKVCDDQPNALGKSVYCDATSTILLELGKLPEALAMAKEHCNADGVGCRTLATMYETGQGTKKDPQAAIALYRKMCRTEFDVMTDGWSDHPVCTKPGVKP